VRIDQQVRCARCDHVWRISESDFVIADDARDENEMPEAFSGFDPEGIADGHPADPAAQDPQGAHGSVPADAGGAWNAGSTSDAGSAWAEDSADRDFEASSDWPAGEDDPADDSYAAAQDDGAPDAAQYTDDRENAGPSSEDAEGFDRRLADSFFSNTLDQSGDAEAADTEPHAAFERIMEGIEEVIAERGVRDDSPAVDTDDPLRALLSEERAQAFGRPAQDDRPAGEAGSEGDWGGKVVRLAARSGEKRVESRMQDEQSMRRDENEAAESTDNTEPMAELIDKIAAVRADALDLDEEDERTGEVSAADPVERAQDPISQAHFEALEADMENAAHATQASADDDLRDRSAEDWGQEGYHDEAHDEALRESLAFDTQRTDFGGEESTSPHHDPVASASERDRDNSLGERERLGARQDDSDHDLMRDELADDMFTAEALNERRHDQRTATTDMQDDDALLAEYDFDDEDDDLTEESPDVGGPARRDAGTLTVAAAWALFFTVVAAGAVSAISFRDQIAGVLPASMPVYAAIGFAVDPPPLVFGEVSYSWDDSQPDTLILTGQISNNQDELTEMPNMQIAARDENGDLLVEESKTLRQPALLPGETYDFRVRVQVAPDKLRTLELSF